MHGASQAWTSVYCSVRFAVHDAYGTVELSMMVDGHAVTMFQVSSSLTSNPLPLAWVSVKSSENEPPDGHGVNVAPAGGMSAV